MGSLVSPIVANLYMEHFEREAVWSSSTPRYCIRFVDDTFVIQQQSHKQLCLDHVNDIDPAIRFTVEGNQENQSIPFLDTLVKPEADNPCLLLCTTSPPILTSTYSGIAIIISPLNIVS